MIRLSLMTLIFCSTFASAAPKTGEAAPPFTAIGADGQTYHLADFKGKTVVLEWFNKDCPYVHKFYDSKTMQNLQKEAKSKGVIWLTVASSAPGREGHLDKSSAQSVYKDMGMESKALLIDDRGEVARLYSAKTTPHMFVINKKGLIAYQGAIDDHPSATAASLAGAHNYVTEALTEVLADRPAPVLAKDPYGCSVKY